jgi:ribosomal protein L24E
MAKCAYCGSTILFGGKQASALRFCNDKCLGKGQIVLIAGSVPDDVVKTQARSVHAGPCPICNEQRGPVDAYTSHKIISFLVMTQFSSTPRIATPTR